MFVIGPRTTSVTPPGCALAASTDELGRAHLDRPALRWREVDVAEAVFTVHEVRWAGVFHVHGFDRAFGGRNVLATRLDEAKGVENRRQAEETSSSVE